MNAGDRLIPRQCGVRALSWAVLAIFVAGCCPHTTRNPYEGPTDPIQRVVDDINQNNQRVRTIWAKGDFKAWIPDEKQHVHFVDGDVALLYMSPDNLRLIGTKPLVGRVFDIGTNGRQYWMIVKPEVDTMWYGDYSHAANSTQEIPVRPDLLLEVLGVGTIDTDLTRQPVPIMRFNNDEDAYMLVWNMKSSGPPDRWVAQKEVWYDRATKRPKLVLLFDENGRIVLRAYLSDHKPIETEDGGASSPDIPGRFDLYFPHTKTKMQLTLNDVRTSNKGIPSDASFKFPGLNAAAKTINIDESSGR
jgi:hypothetical protein